MTGTVGSELERQRLEHRALRLRLVVAALRDRVGEASASGGVPAPLHRALADFSAELAHVRELLGELRFRSSHGGDSGSGPDGGQSRAT